MNNLVPEEIEGGELSKAESKRLQELEDVIEENFKGFVVVGMALAEINEKRLYREHFATFEAYCAELWEVNRRRAYQLIDAAHVVENVKNFSQNALPLPANDAQARELSKLPPKEQVEVWRNLVGEAQANDTKVTAKAVKKAVLTFKGEAINKVVETAKKESREKRTDFQSEEFTEAFNRFFEQVRVEKEHNWRYTSRKTVFRILQGLLDVVSEAVPGTMDGQGCSMELSDRDKLSKKGFRIFRMDTKRKVIEEWLSRDTWILYEECGSAKALNDRFKELMDDHTHLRA